MKWYNADKYDPPSEMDLICYCSFSCWDKLIIAKYKLPEERFYSFEHDANGKLINELQVDVTHFCIPDPIEFE